VRTPAIDLPDRQDAADDHDLGKLPELLRDPRGVQHFAEIVSLVNGHPDGGSGVETQVDCAIEEAA
jgi:hypothetical protein